MTRVLLAGDHFVRNDLLAAALADRAPHQLEFSEVVGAWPYQPFGRVAEVDEASANEDEILEAVRGVEVAVTQMAPFTARVLAAADRLRLIVCCRGGPVNVNVTAATERGVAVTYTPGRNATAAAEHTVALLLAALRRSPYTQATLFDGQWRSDLYAYDECGLEIDGTTVGLIGYGAIGRRVAATLHALGAEVLVHDPYADPAALPAQPPVRLVGLDELLRRSRIVSLHARLTESSHGLIGRKQLALMPRGGVLVNTARGGLLDYGALCDALDDGQLAAAALDVFDTEPLAEDSRLRRTRNLVATPHLAGATRQTAARAVTMAAEEVARYLRHEPPAHLANPDVPVG
jgi:D-3-phosphoglycerate dehydrogenase